MASATLLAHGIEHICDALSLSDMWRYVCNAMECHINCCNDFLQCDCITSEIEIESDDDDDDDDCDLCCIYNDCISTVTSTSDDVQILSDDVQILSNEQV